MYHAAVLKIYVLNKFNLLVSKETSAGFISEQWNSLANTLYYQLWVVKLTKASKLSALVETYALALNKGKLRADTILF